MAIDPAELFKAMFTASKGLGRKPFPELVEASCGHKVVKIDMTDAVDKRLVELLVKAMKNFVESTKKSKTRYQGNRANDVGKNMEKAIIEEMKKHGFIPTQLGESGYPDLLVEFEGKKTYIELKTSGQTNKKDTNYRMFYFTTGKKIKTDAHHLLLQVQIFEEANKYWRVESWQLRDLYELRLGLKAEWNGNNQDIDALGTLSQG